MTSLKSGQIEILCAWCGKVIGFAIANLSNGSIRSHGICQKCLDKQLANLEQKGGKNEHNEG